MLSSLITPSYQFEASQNRPVTPTKNCAEKNVSTISYTVSSKSRKLCQKSKSTDLFQSFLCYMRDVTWKANQKLCMKLPNASNVVKVDVKGTKRFLLLKKTKIKLSR